MEPKIIFEDESILVINKPAGMIVNKADTTKGEETVQDWVEKKFKMQGEKLKVDEESDFYKRAGIVHRLDKETSGILLVAKTLAAFENLQAQFKERIVKKKYIALAHGEVRPPEGEINVTVGRLPWNRKRFGVIPGGRESLTRYKVLRNYTRHSGKPGRAHPESHGDSGQARMTYRYSLLELAPFTGRTHQIRVHLKYLGFPIVSDELYAGRKQARGDRKWCERLFLHAAEISFLHPVKKEMVTLQSSLPSDLENALAKLTHE